MDYDVVIVTLNRPKILSVSIPLILRQEPPPHSLIVVDASNSDVHEQVQHSVNQAVGDSGVYFEILRSKPNTAHQRNVGMERVRSPIVMFPDDDSLWWPSVAEAIMRIYEQDTNDDIGGVCGRETAEPPPGTDIAARAGYEMNKSDHIRQKLQSIRHKFDYKFCPDPLWIHGQSRWKVRPFPQFLRNIDSALVEFMGGFRMSFRTELIRKYGFDEELGKYAGYAAYEDADASFKILQEKLLVGAHDAHVYHYKAPNKRANGFELGFILLFNRAYIICRYSPPGSRARRSLKGFGKYKLMQYLLGMTSRYGRERVRGTLAALKSMDELLNCPADRLREKYLGICDREINRNSPDNNE
ncbi:MAG: glycosyltransferase family 2 protein [Planctomycetota bacterium]|nr:MAG: glycosyltransferase family 2 protein [Planctomycetota bacterium]